MTFITAYLIAVSVLAFALAVCVVCQGDGIVIHVLYRQYGLGVFVALPCAACFQAWIIMLFPATMITLLCISAAFHMWMQYKYSDEIRQVLRDI